MLAIIKLVNGVKKIIPLTADIGAGNPVGTVIVVCSNQIPSNYLPLGTQYDTSLYPVLYALLGTDTTPTASALGLPTLTSGQYAIKATSGLSENAQDNVINTLNEERSYSTEEHATGKKWIDGKMIYELTCICTTSTSGNLLHDTWSRIDSYFSPIANVQGNIDTIISTSLKTRKYANINVNTFVDSGVLKIDPSQSIGLSKDNSFITINYTKTTD